MEITAIAAVVVDAARSTVAAAGLAREDRATPKPARTRPRPSGIRFIDQVASQVLHLVADFREPTFSTWDPLLNIRELGRRQAIIAPCARALDQFLQVAVMAREFAFQSALFGRQFLGTVGRLPLRLADRFRDEQWVTADAFDLFHHEPFDFAGRNRARRAGMPAALLGRGANVIPIVLRPTLRRMGRRHRALARHTVEEALEDARNLFRTALPPVRPLRWSLAWTSCHSSSLTIASCSPSWTSSLYLTFPM